VIISLVSTTENPLGIEGAGNYHTY